MNAATRFSSIVALLSCVVSAGADDSFDYRRLLTPPETVPQFWDAVKFELEVGRPDLAAAHLRNLILKLKPPADLLELYKIEGGIAPFLRLGLVRKWTDDAAKEGQARKDVAFLIDEMLKAVRGRLNDPVRIDTYLRQLEDPKSTDEDRGFARAELIDSGTGAIPIFIKALESRPEVSPPGDRRPDRQPILNLLTRMKSDIVRPLLAALEKYPDPIDKNVPDLRENLLDVLLRRPDLPLLRDQGIDVAAAVWPLASSLNPIERLRRKAYDVLRVVYNVRSNDLLPSPITALIEESDRYYYRTVRFTDPQKVAIWQWDGKELKENETFKQRSAEEYLGLRLARLALRIDPSDRRAQLAVLNWRIDRGYEAPDKNYPLGRLKPTVEESLLKLNTDLLNDALEAGLRDENDRVILATLQALGRIGDLRALTPRTQGEPAVVRALHHGDERVRMAAVDAILRIPDSAVSSQAASRIVYILKAALIPDLAALKNPRILVAGPSDGYTLQIAAALKQSGFEEIPAKTGRQVVKRLLARADIDAVILDSTITDPGLPWVLAQLRGDVNLRRLPVFVAAVPDNQDTRDLLIDLSDARSKQKILDELIQERVVDLANLARTSSYAGAILGRDLVLEQQREKRRQLEDKMLALVDRYERETRAREVRLRKELVRLKNVFVDPPTQFIDSRLLSSRLDERFKEIGRQSPSPAERKAFAELSLEWLAKLAAGQVKGYDVKPAEDAVTGMLSADVSEAAQINAIRVLGRTSGGGAQRQLIGMVQKEGLKPAVRIAAVDELMRHIQEYGRPSPEMEKNLRDAIDIAVRQPIPNPALRNRLLSLVGALRPSNRKVGERLLDPEK